MFVYKLSTSPETASEWGAKKAIVNKFVQQEPVTTMVWPGGQTKFEKFVVYGTAGGKVRVGNTKNNKSQSMYNVNSYTVSLACSAAGNAVVSGHADGTIYRFFLDDENGPQPHGVLTKHRSPPYALTWGQNVMAAGPDKCLVVYDDSGAIMQSFDYASIEDEKEASVAICSPNGQSAVFGSYNRLRAYNFDMRVGGWVEQPTKTIENLYTVTALGWKCDGTRLAVGTLCGAVELFDCALKRTIYKGKFEFTHIGPTQVIVKTLSTGSRIVLRSNYNYEIEKINVLGGDRFLVAHTTDTLLLGDLLTCKLSEIPWMGSGKEKFYFENPAVCMIFNAGELTLVEYGQSDVLGSVRTEHMNPHLLSVRLNDRVRRGEGDVKRIAYLIDLKTIAVMDLVYGSTIATINHDAKIDWLELNETGRKLLFRDKRRRLKLFDLNEHDEAVGGISILDHCSYVQWVPMSDVIVAQNRSNLCIWYNIEAPERVTTFPIKGDVVDIERDGGHTEVLVDEGVTRASYGLDEGLIEFGTAVDDGDFVRACNFLETLEATPESEAMWKTLGDLALENGELHIAERCYAALGNVSKAKFLRDVNDLALGSDEGYDQPMVRAKLAILNKHFKLAESLLLEQGQADQTIDMYKALHKWDDALAVAEAKRHENLDQLQADYHQYLADTNQDEKAAELKEAEGDLQGALQLYMKAGLPTRAAQLVATNDSLSSSTDVIERVASSLEKAGLHAKAGELFELARFNQRALDAYRKGHAYRKAVELCRAAFPAEVVAQEEAWGDYLVSTKQLDGAINHYIEAGVATKAVDAAIKSRQWTKAAQVVEAVDNAEEAQQYYLMIAVHYEEIRELPQAEKFYLAGGEARKAVDMYIKAQDWDAAHRAASQHMDPNEVAELYIAEAETLESKNRYTDAEKLYVKIKEPDLAINMYKKCKRYDDMIRLVKKHHQDLLATTHIHLARELETDQQHAQAEHHFVAGEDWKSAVNMYRGMDMWDDAYRVSKVHGGVKAAQQVGYLWARHLGGDSAVKLLSKFGMIETAIDFACESQAIDAFEFAFNLANAVCKNKLPHIHLKRAMWYEDQGKFPEAEAEFIKADKPREAVLMHVHTQDWDAAQRVAEKYDSDSVKDVLVGQARVAFANKEYQRAETYLLRAQRPELIVEYYQHAGMWDDVLRLAKEYLPKRLAEFQAQEREARAANHGTNEGSDPAMAIRQEAREHEMNNRHSDAVSTYLRLDAHSSNNIDLLEECWEKAVELASKFVQDRHIDTVRIASERLIEVGRFEAAADLYLGADLVKEAIDAFMSGGAWDKARGLANEYNPEYLQEVEARMTSSLQRGGGAGDARQLLEVDVEAGLDMYAKRGEWDLCLEKAAQTSAATLEKYVALYAAQLVKENRPVDAVQLFGKHGAPANESNVNIYRYIVHGLVSSREKTEYKSWAQARDMYFTLAKELAQKGDAQITSEFERYTVALHYEAFRAANASVGPLNEITCKLSMSLLRHTEDLVPADKAFYEAGMACIQVGWESMAFVFLNRYLDLSEAIDEGNLDALDNTDFAGTDIPFEVRLPQEQFLSVSDPFSCALGA